MLWSAVIYSLFMGPWLAMGLILMIFIHEMGHVAALRLLGREVSAPLFIPFFGAVIFSGVMDRRDDEAFVGIGGPLLGSFAAILVFAGWMVVADKQSELAQFLLVVSMIGVMINLFNLIPVGSLDGGRITQAVGPWVSYLGIALLIWLSVVASAPMVWMLWLILIPSITFLSRNVRFTLAVGVWLVMTTQHVLGFSAQSLVTALVHCTIGALFVFANRSSNLDAVQVAAQARPQLPLLQRFLWLVCYLVLVAVLVTVIVWMTPFLKQLPVP